MSAFSPDTIPLFGMRLGEEPDVVLCRNRAKLVAEKFGFGRQDQIRIATAVSEIARNAFRYAREASAEFLFEQGEKNGSKGKPPQFVCLIRDKGPGIPNLEEVLSGRYKSGTGMGMGIRGAHKLMDTVDVQTSPAGTIVRLSRALPKGQNPSLAAVRVIAGSITGPGLFDPVEELASQDQEIIYMMEEVGETKEELTKVNEELSETNRGVVALYDELDTVYRVGHVLASKLDLDELLQALIDATTEISGAEVGIFVYDERDSEGKPRQHVAGVLSEFLRQGEALSIHQLLGTSSASPVLLNIEDLERERRVLSPLREEIALRSYLAIPVVLSAGTVSGAMVFAHRSASVFSERSERILSSVALQAAVGIENAKLYKTVRTANAAKDEFLAILSHELRNPLNPIFARLSLLEENPAMNAAALEDLRLIRRNLELETRLIDDLLDMTRISRGKIVIARSPVDLHEIIEAASHACSVYSAEHGVEVELELHSPDFVVMGDAVRLQQVFWNLINNGIKFGGAGTKVTVWTKRMNGNRIRITVRDCGTGIASGKREVIFQPFVQAEPDTAALFGGLGLGLAICRNLISGHGGEIKADSDGLGKGATFSVILPVTKEALMESRKLPTVPVSVPEKQTFRILFVDDHEDTRRSFKSLLERRGHEVTIAGTVAEARLKAQNGLFDLLVSDIGLPDGTGYELMRALGNSSLKGIAVSGYGMREDITKSREAGFARHITKPLRIADLDDCISQIMGER